MSYLESEALCPYFKGDSKLMLQCECGKLFFGDKEEKREIGYGLCADKFEQCPLKKARDRFYERSDLKAPGRRK